MAPARKASRAGRPPGVSTGADGLTATQRYVLASIEESVRTRGYPPSLREIGAYAGLESTSSVTHQLRNLERMGLIHRDPHRARSYTVSALQPAQKAASGNRPAGEVDAVEIPLLGRIAAGPPLLAEESAEDTLILPRQIVGTGELFALTVSGDSMTGAHIRNGDIVVIRAQAQAEHGEIVAALLDGAATVKRIRRQDAQTWLVAENPNYPPIDATHAAILGKVVCVLRTL
ncbi:transcriptional repressor LexA [Streptomyces sp. NPDC001941]|uniref:transcriptional repressor LexA n=1 Tax=Streptomyces sp. NPDC001941 TaxID=3154659 RepID=UPI0033340601